MMELFVGEVIVLNDNKKYAVASIISYFECDFCYVVSLDNYDDTKICLFDNNELFEVVEGELLEKLEILFSLE